MLRTPLFNFALFQVGWFATAFCISAQRPELALLSQALILLVHFYVHPKRSELAFVGVAATLGFAMDCVFTGFSIVDFWPPKETLLPHPWLFGLWLLFSTTLNHSLSWMMRFPTVAILLAGVSGPFTYYIAGRTFGIVTFAEPLLWNLVGYSLAWALYMALIILFERKTRPHQRT